MTDTINPADFYTTRERRYIILFACDQEQADENWWFEGDRVATSARAAVAGWHRDYPEDIINTAYPA